MSFRTRINLPCVNARNGEVARASLPVLKGWVRANKMEEVLMAIKVEWGEEGEGSGGMPSTRSLLLV